MAELLFKNGFKEAYAIEGGLRGKDGWQVSFSMFNRQLCPMINGIIG